MIYILAVLVALIVAAIIWSIEREEREEELKGQLTKSDLRELMRFYNDNLKNQKP
jgi:hypothetical protein